MRYQPCDELASDLYTAGMQWGVSLDYATAERLIEYVNGKYPAPDFEGLLERALDLEFVLEDAQRHAYKCALGLFYNRRAKYAREQRKARDDIPFSPR